MMLESDLVKRIIALERRLAEIEAREKAGIGTSNLTVGTLTVTGSESVGDTLTVTNNAKAGSLTITGAANVNSLTVTNGASAASLGVTGNANVGSLTSSGAANVGSLTSSGSASAASLTITNNASVGGDLTVTGNANVSGSLNHNGYAGSIYVPLATWGTVYSNSTLAVGTYTINSQSYGVPAGAKAVEIRTSGICATASSTNYVAFRATGTANLNIVMRSVVSSTLSNDANGKVHLDANGQFDVVVAGAQWTTVYLFIAGYYI